jgi:hypothetical protein
VGMRTTPFPPALVADLRAVVERHGFLPYAESVRLAPIHGYCPESITRVAVILRRQRLLPPIDMKRLRDSVRVSRLAAARERSKPETILTPDELARRCAEVRAERRRPKRIDPTGEAAFRRHYIRTEVARMRGYLGVSPRAVAAWNKGMERMAVA